MGQKYVPTCNMEKYGKESKPVVPTYIFVVRKAGNATKLVCNNNQQFYNKQKFYLEIILNKSSF